MPLKVQTNHERFEQLDLRDLNISHFKLESNRTYYEWFKLHEESEVDHNIVPSTTALACDSAANLR
jgi:hypothetical protein